MSYWKGRSVQNSGRERLRSSRLGAVPAAAKHGKDRAARRDTDRPVHHALPSSVQVETTSRKRVGQKNRRRKASGAGATKSTPQKRKTRMVAALSSVQGRAVRHSAIASRGNNKRSSSGNKARMGRVRSRMRGGASHPCPVCSHATRVLRTTKVATTVQRHRQCLHCDHEYVTTERRAGEH